jgi:hypothetical protein
MAPYLVPAPAGVDAEAEGVDAETALAGVAFAPTAVRAVAARAHPTTLRRTAVLTRSNL